MRRGSFLLLTFLLAGCTGGCTPASEGERLFRERCGRCHPLETPLSVRRDQEGWRRTVWAMRQRGAALTDEEADAVVRYLTRVRGR